MKTRIVAAMVATLACTPGTLGPHRMPAVAATTAPLYQADWTAGLNGWNVYLIITHIFPPEVACGA
ncbi:MAG: hypothetical protein ACRDGS_16745 [Chloroflexota bacterium]